MPVYDFGNSYIFSDKPPAGPRSFMPVSGATELNPILDPVPISVTQLSDVEPRFDIEGNRDQTVSGNGYVESHLQPGFLYLDTAMKSYFGDIRIPQKDSVRFMDVKIAGGSKAVQLWITDMNMGRVKLPVMSIDRKSHSFNPEKFSPPYIAMVNDFLNKSGSKIRKTFRPSPWNVQYNLEIWAESKENAEYAIYQIMTRFNPLAEFVASDDHVIGTVTMKCGDVVDASEKDVGAEQIAKIKYELPITAEAWLSLPHQIVPSILSISGSVRLDNEIIPFSRIRY